MEAEGNISQAEATLEAARGLSAKARYKSRATIAAYVRSCLETGTSDVSILRRCIAVLEENGDVFGIKPQLLSRIEEQTGAGHETLGVITGDVDTRLHAIALGDPGQLENAGLRTLDSRELLAATQDRLLAFRGIPDAFVTAELRHVSGAVPTLTAADLTDLVSSTGPDLITVVSERVALAGTQCIAFGFEEYAHLSLAVPSGIYSSTICYYELEDGAEDDRWPEVSVRAILAGPIQRTP